MPEIGREDVDQEYGGNRVRLCDGKLCNANDQRKSVAVKSCHHEVCQAQNNGLPLALCLKCDDIHHLGKNSSHARFELNNSRMKLTRSPSSQSNTSDHDSGAEEDISETVRVEKKTRGYSTGKRIFKLTTNPKRKPRRHNTDDPGRDFFTVKFHGPYEDDVEVEVVPALKGKSLKESLEPMFSSRDMSFLTHSVFIDASNTPLPLSFDTFPMRGNLLHVRANGVVKVDQRVIDIVQKIEDSKQPGDCDQRTRSRSIAENGSLSRAKGNIKKLEQDEKEREAKEQLKTSQRGRKNILNFFGEESGNNSIVLSDPVLQSVNNSKQGTLHRPRSTSKLTGLFNQPKQTKQETPAKGATIKDVLDIYTVYGLDDLSYSSIKDQHHSDDLKLEETWTDVVDSKWIENMNKKEKDQQEAIWELLATEVTYIHKISIIKKLFILCLRNLQNEGFLQDIEIPKLFSNIETIYELNLSFWLDCLRDVVEESRKTGRPLNPLHMSEGFPMFDKRFEPYIDYCKEEAHCLKYFKKKMKEDEDFKIYITWCEEHPLCTNRLKLSDHLVKPMQRLTKYPLLLKAIHKKTLDEDMKEAISAMISTVESLLGKVNTAMRVMYEKNKLQAIAKRIKNNYNVVEAVNDEMEKILMEYTAFDLMEHMHGLDQHRCVITEGPLRLVEKQGKMDVHVFLFTDLLLITKAKKGDKYRVIKPPMMVDKLSVHASKDPGTFLLVYMNEYNTVVQAFALQGSNIDQISWMENIKKAQKLFMIAQLEHGPSYMTPQSESSDLISPSAFVSNPDPFQIRRPSAISVVSLDSDDEMGLNESFRVNNLTRYPSDATINTEIFPEKEGGKKTKESIERKTETTLEHLSDNTINTEMIPEKEGFKIRKESVEKKTETVSEIVDQKGADELIPKIPPGNPNVIRLRSEVVAKVSRSSSAPQKERPKADLQISLSRSCSEPNESKNFLRKTAKGEIITEGLPLETTSRASISSSSLSADEVKSESESSSLRTSLDLTSSFSLDNPQEDSNVFESPSARLASDDNESCSPVSDVSSFEAKCCDDHGGQTGRPVARSASAPIPLGPRETRPHSVSGDQGATGETGDAEVKSATFPRRSGNRKKSSPGLKALQSLSESLEFSLKEPAPKVPPQIKSPLIAQKKLQSAINPVLSEPPRKKTSLPRRSSPLMSRKPETLMRSKSYGAIETVATSPDRVNEFLTLSSDYDEHPNNESNDYDDPNNDNLSSLRRTESENSRLPVKPDRLHYTGLNLAILDSSAGRTSPIPPTNVTPNNPIKKSSKKSMSLTDLLSIGRDLTSGRDKNDEKNISNYASKKERLLSDSTDDRRERTPKRAHRFRLGRSKSRSSDHELKDGIASGPDIDKRKATKLFLRDSLMLESSNTGSSDHS